MYLSHSPYFNNQRNPRGNASFALKARTIAKVEALFEPSGCILTLSLKRYQANT
ncbi:MAG: hypothetical protein ACO1RA_10420 [Planctomycetaceae bacterium]